LERKAARELYQAYNQIIGKIVTMVNHPEPWILQKTK
jgi:hypothetical protein